MSNTLGKNLHFCFSIIKRPQNQLTNSPNHNLLESPPVTVTKTATVFTKNYNSLFEDITSISLPPIASPSSLSDPETDYDSLEDLAPATPDLTAAYASRRFFISSPGRSNSIVDSLSLSSLEEKENEEEGSDDHPPEVAGGVAVETYSPDPYLDFRRSMQEMVEARGVAREEVGGAWEYLQELLLSYLSLNPKSTHKYIVRAFADVVVSSMSPINTSSTPCYSSYCGGNNCTHNNSAYVGIFDNAA